MSAKLIETTSTKPYAYTGNYVLVLKGSCQIGGKTFAEDMLVVSKAIEPQPYDVRATEGETCLAMGVSF